MKIDWSFLVAIKFALRYKAYYKSGDNHKTAANLLFCGYSGFSTTDLFLAQAVSKMHTIGSKRLAVFSW